MLISGTFAAMNVSALTPSTLSQGLKELSPHPESSFWCELISRIADAAGIDPQIAVQVASHESGLNPRALNQTSGAIGIMQLLPATAAELGVNPHSAVENIRGGVEFLRRQFAAFGDTAKALAAYNWGPHRVSQAIGRWGEAWLDHAPTETRQYVNSIVSRVGNPTSVDLDSEAARFSVTTLGPSATARVGSNSEAPLPTAGKLRILQSVLDAYLLLGILS
jgi:soluble lytic murein transglycosylase-like protein